MKPTLPRLTHEQQVIAAENSSLIYDFLFKRGLDEEQWYSYCAEAYIRAVHDHDPKKGKLSTVAYVYMTNMVRRELGVQKRKKNRAIEISLDAPAYANNETLTVGELLPAQENELDGLLADVTVQQMLNRLDPQQRRMVQLRLAGYYLWEIGNKCGISAEAVRKQLQKAAEQMRHTRLKGALKEYERQNAC